MKRNMEHAPTMGCRETCPTICDKAVHTRIGPTIKENMFNMKFVTWTMNAHCRELLTTQHRGNMPLPVWKHRGALTTTSTWSTVTCLLWNLWHGPWMHIWRSFDHAAQGKHVPTCVKTQRSMNRHEYMVDSDAPPPPVVISRRGTCPPSVKTLGNTTLQF